MDLSLEDYQDLTVKTFRDFFARHATPNRVRETEGSGHDADLWKKFTDLGGATLSVSEPGGGGGNLLDAALVGIEAGRSVAPIPYAEAVAALRLADAAGLSLGDFALGDEPVVVATASPGGAFSGGRLTAPAPYARGGSVAVAALVAIGEELALIDFRAPEVTVQPLANVGRLSLGRVECAAAPVLWSRPDAAALVRRSVHELRLLRAAELVGAGRQALALTLEHLQTRHQFGRPIGSFQAIQHRMVDRLTAVDAAELLVLRAASYDAEQDADQLRYYSALALLQSAEAAELAAKEGLQFFGGYGFTLEYDIHLFLRFAKALSILAKDPDLVDDSLPLRIQSPSKER
ncbi:acyl-CoA dehydrogenase family protein [Sporichthya polymorpha]|uniref:acyl-CoA dehydrogenase family protein n=1 Tax=Sporichthya polymorpha TaxID=35751 RepID=UPI00037B22BC|nr:acyl-CoA dehydrogenase family protein [Sporichthya polymorpha]